MHKCFIIAEAGCNHMGDLTIAKKMILSAYACGADYIKFQKRSPEISTPLHLRHNPHPEPYNSFGDTYLDHRKALEFDIEQHRDLKKYCDDIGIKYSCSVWDIISASEIISLHPDYIKIPSAMNNNYELIKFVYDNFNGDVHISLGMATKQELSELFKFIKPYSDRTVLYWTTSGYPVKFEELFLCEILDIKLCYRVGYSGHHLGIAVDLVAYAFGAECIERHFTLDRTWKGTDHAVSLEPPGLTTLCRDIRAAQKSMSYKNGLTEDEKKNRSKLRINK